MGESVGDGLGMRDTSFHAEPKNIVADWGYLKMVNSI